MACSQQLGLPGPLGLSKGAKLDGGAALRKRLSAENGGNWRQLAGNGSKGVWRKQALEASNQSAFFGHSIAQRRQSFSTSKPTSVCESCSCSLHRSATPLLRTSLPCRHSQTNSGFGGRPSEPFKRDRSTAVRAEQQDSEGPSANGGEETPEEPSTSEGGRQNEPPERFGKGAYPNPYPILPRYQQDWQKPKRETIPGYEIHYHADGRRFTEEEEAYFELERKNKVVDEAFQEYERQCAAAFAKGDFAPIPPPRVMRLPAKVSNLVQTAQDGLEYMVPDANVYDPGITLDEALENMRAAVGYQDYYKQGIVTVKGNQELFKIPGEYTWQFEVRTGRFYEQWKSPQLSTCLGWNGNPNASVWDANMQGKVRLLDLDDLEVVFLAHWVRSGYYLNRSLETKRLINLSIPNYQPEPGEFLLRIRMNKKLIKGTIVYDRETWLPKRFTMKVFGTCEERWHFNEWRRMKPDLACLHPVEVIKEHVGSAGKAHMRVESFETRPPLTEEEENQPLPFDVPLIPYHKATPEDPAPRQIVEWTGDEIVNIKMIRTESGHILVRPLVDGQDLGLYVFDTGASMLTITREHAAKMNMPQFGEINVVTATGEFPTPFRRGRSWQLGPVLIREPLFMEVDHLSEVITGYDPAEGPIVGAVGHDLLFSATVHLRLNEAGTADVGMQLQRPDTYTPNPDDVGLMQRVQMIGGCPVTRGTFGRYNDLFLVDTGAGGVDVIFNKRGVAKYDLLNSRRRRGNLRIKGVSKVPGQEDSAARLFSAEVPFILGGYTFKKPKQALLCIEENMFDISEYVIGVICGEMLEGSRIVFDYPRLRWAIIRDPLPGEEKPFYDYDLVVEWEKFFGHNEELAGPIGYEVNENPVGL